jgi:hypothetical protein
VVRVTPPVEMMPVPTWLANRPWVWNYPKGMRQRVPKCRIGIGLSMRLKRLGTLTDRNEWAALPALPLEEGGATGRMGFGHYQGSPGFETT